jgi:hypothetical protein
MLANATSTAELQKPYYFSTHGCKRFGSCLLVELFEELACAAACCRAFRLKKSAMLSSRGGLGVVAGMTISLSGTRANATRVHVQARTGHMNSHPIASPPGPHCIKKLGCDITLDFFKSSYSSTRLSISMHIRASSCFS